MKVDFRLTRSHLKGVLFGVRSTHVQFPVAQNHCGCLCECNRAVFASNDCLGKENYDTEPSSWRSARYSVRRFRQGMDDQHLFKLWFERHFLRYVPAVCPLLLSLDGHSSHYYTETIQLASEEDVILFALPPNTTHLTQPLDKGACIWAMQDTLETSMS